MSASHETRRREPTGPGAMRTLAEQAFSRSAGAPLIAGNRIRLLRDAAENYPAWLAAISGARAHVHFENYILADDHVGATFADALIERAQAGVQVRCTVLEVADQLTAQEHQRLCDRRPMRMSGAFDPPCDHCAAEGRRYRWGRKAANGVPFLWRWENGTFGQNWHRLAFSGGARRGPGAASLNGRIQRR